MTIDDFVKDLEEIIEENKNIDEEQLGLIYCDDTECIEEHKLRLNQYLEKCEQLVEWLEELKYLRKENEWLKLKLLSGNTNKTDERTKEIKKEMDAVYNAFIQYKANKAKARNEDDIGRI